MESFSDHVGRLIEAKHKAAKRDGIPYGFTRAKLIELALDPENGLSHGTVRNYVEGKRRGKDGGTLDLPSKYLIERVAKYLDVYPEEFAAYRIHLARDRLLPNQVGFDQAAANADLLLSQSAPTAGEAAQAASRQHHERHPEPVEGAPPSRVGGGES